MTKPAKKETRKKVEPTEANVKIVQEKCYILDYSVTCIRKVLGTTWKEAVALRHAALKSDAKK